MNQRITLTREALYDLVWTTPITQLCRIYGLSDVGLKKICKRMEIPTPIRGYWRKLECGKKVTQKKLPKLSKHGIDSVIISLRSEAHSADASPPPRVIDGLDEVLVNMASNPGLHPLVEKTAEALAKAKPDEKGLLEPRAKRNLAIHVSPESLDRALASLNQILLALEALGHTVNLNADKIPTTRISLLGEELGVSLEEKVSTTPHVETEADRRRKDRWNIPRYDYTPTGKLIYRIEGNLPRGTRLTWSDGKIQRVENLTSKIIYGIYDAAEAQTQKRLDDELRAREREEEHKRWEEARRQRAILAQREKHLDKMATQWATAEKMRAFLDEVVSNKDTLSDLAIGELDVEEWLEWAHQYVDAIDPVKNTVYWDIEKEVPIWEVRDIW